MIPLPEAIEVTNYLINDTLQSNDERTKRIEYEHKLKLIKKHYRIPKNNTTEQVNQILLAYGKEDE